jgi:hypothetical protein
MLRKVGDVHAWVGSHGVELPVVPTANVTDATNGEPLLDARSR